MKAVKNIREEGASIASLVGSELLPTANPQASNIPPINVVDSCSLPLVYLRGIGSFVWQREW